MFSQTSIRVWGKTRNKSVSWGNGQLKAGPEVDKIWYLQAAVTGPKNVKNWTPFPKSTSFYCKVVHGHLLPHRSPSGRLPLKTAGSKHLKSFSFCGNGYRASTCNNASSAKTKVDYYMWNKSLKSASYHTRTLKVWWGEHLWYVYKKLVIRCLPVSSDANSHSCCF